MPGLLDNGGNRGQPEGCAVYMGCGAGYIKFIEALETAKRYAREVHSEDAVARYRLLMG